MRFRDGPTYLAEFAGTILVRCPRCDGRAIVADDPSGRTGYSRGRRVICPACGYTRVGGQGGGIPGAIADGALGLPLWLQTPCCGEILWAYNGEHLAFLEGYVGATLRERTPNANSSLASRLPAWLTSAKHRDDVLRGLARLRALL